MYASYYKKIDQHIDHPITLAGAKHHLQEMEDINDPLIDILIGAATDFVEGHCDIALMPQIWEERMNTWPLDRRWEVRKAPFINVESLKYIDEDGDEQTVASTDYAVSLEHGIPYVYLMDEVTISHKSITGAIRLQYRAGYEASGLIPDTIIAAMLLIIRDLYDKRADHDEGIKFNDLASRASINLLRQHKRY